MQRRSLGWTDAQLPVVGQGTWQMEQDDRDECIATLRRGLDVGLTHIDTAEMYGDGYVEEAIVSQAIAGRREEVFLTSKVLPDHASQDGTLRACERSLERLGTDHLDLYLLHWRGRHPLADTIAAFERLVTAGKIRFYGVSNFDAADVDEAVGIAGPERLACNQVLYHLQERAIERAVVPTCERHRVAVVAYSPFGHGAFPSPRSAPGRALSEIASRHGVTARALALAFLARRPSLFVIPKTTSPQHTVENAAAGTLKLSHEELHRLDVAFPAGPVPTSLPML